MSAKSPADISFLGFTSVVSLESISAAPIRDLARAVLAVTYVPLILMSQESSRLSSFIFLGQLSTSSPMSVYEGVAVKLIPPDVAPRIADSSTVPVAVVNALASIPALS